MGQNTDCHMILTGDPKVSRHHCLLDIAPSLVNLCDLGSRHGTLVNEVRSVGQVLSESREQGRNDGSEIGAPALSWLESSTTASPTMETVCRVAQTLGKRVTIELEDATYVECGE
jgi:hypothetical protein